MTTRLAEPPRLVLDASVEGEADHGYPFVLTTADIDRIEEIAQALLELDGVAEVYSAGR